MNVRKHIYNQVIKKRLNEGLIGDEDNYEICYTTPIASDVIGYLSPDEVNSIIEDIKKLPSTLETISKNRDLKIEDLCG